MTTIRSAQPTELDVLATTLANAFGEDPLFRWITDAAAGESIEPKLRVMFGALAKQELRRDDHLVFTTDDRLGVAVWLHPNQWKMSALTTLKVLPSRPTKSSTMKATATMARRVSRSVAKTEFSTKTVVSYWMR